MKFHRNIVKSEYQTIDDSVPAIQRQRYRQRIEPEFSALVLRPWMQSQAGCRFQGRCVSIDAAMAMKIFWWATISRKTGIHKKRKRQILCKQNDKIDYPEWIKESGTDFINVQSLQVQCWKSLFLTNDKINQWRHDGEEHSVLKEESITAVMLFPMFTFSLLRMKIAKRNRRQAFPERARKRIPRAWSRWRNFSSWSDRQSMHGSGSCRHRRGWPSWTKAIIIQNEELQLQWMWANASLSKFFSSK